MILFFAVYRASQSATYLRRVTEPWDEQTITWNNQPQSTPADQVSVPAPATTTSDFVIDVTNLVRIMNDGQSNYGFLWILNPEQKWRSVFAASSDYSDPAKRPKLVVTYRSPDSRDGDPALAGQPMKKYFYLKDHLGNIRVTVDENGDVKGYNDYGESHHFRGYPFGLRMPGRSMNTALNYALYKFSGKELDEENGINWYYFGARYYDPMIGRWWSVDPLADKYQSLSSYQYVSNNPVINFDPDGKAIYRFGVGYINGNQAKNVTIKTMISALKGEKAQIDFVGITNTFQAHIEDYIDTFLRGGTYSHDFPNPKGVSFGDKIQGNADLANNSFPEIYVQTSFAFKPINSKVSISLIGRTSDKKDLIQLIFTTGTESGNGTNDVIIYTNTIDNIQNILKKAGKRLVKYYYKVNYKNLETGKTWEEERYGYRIEDIEN